MEAEQMEGKKKRFMAYDYKEIEAEGERLSLLLDAYESLDGNWMSVLEVSVRRRRAKRCACAGNGRSSTKWS